MKHTPKAMSLILHGFGGVGHRVLDSAAATLGARRRDCSERIVRPVVLGIAALELLLDVRVGARPEAREILRDLYGAMRGREQVQYDGRAPVAHHRRALQAEHLLQADRKST